MYEEKIKFLISGAFSTFFSYCLYTVLIYLEFKYYFAMTTGYILGYISNLIIGRYWVFKNGARVNSIVGEILGTLIVTILGLFLNLSIISLLSEIMYGMSYYLSGLIAMIIVTFWNYWSRKKWIYK